MRNNSICQFQNASISTEKEVLKDILKSEKNIAVYQRDLFPLQDDLNKTIEKRIECRVEGNSNEVIELLQFYFKKELDECDVLADDICEIFELFNGICNASAYVLSLQTVDSDMCRKFHTDINDLRLLCTYYGPGTLWIPDEHIDQNNFKRIGGREELLLPKEHIQQVEAGDVIIMKGALHPNSIPLMHRSPSSKQKGEKRLLLRIDTSEMLNF